MTQTLTAEEFFLTLDLSFLVFLFAEVGVSAQEPPVRTRNVDSGEQADATIPNESSPLLQDLVLKRFLEDSAGPRGYGISP